MKKSAISLSLLLLMGATALTSCNSSEIKPLRVDGKDVLFSIGDKNFTADELLGSSGDFTYSFLKSEQGAKELYRAIEKEIIQSKVEVDENIENAVEISMDAWKEKVESYAAENGLTERLAEQALLQQEGFETRKDLEASYILAEQKTQLIKDFKSKNIEPDVKDKHADLSKEENKNAALVKYVEDTNPMIMKHILVKTADNANVFNQANITENESINLGTVVKLLATGNKPDNTFELIANNYSEDGSSKNGGNLGIVDEYTSFVNEFKFGVYSSIAYNAKNLDEDKSQEKFESVVSKLNLEKDMFGAQGIYETMGTIEVADAVTALIDKAPFLGNQKEGKDEDYTLYPRNLKFNEAFNFSGVKYLHVADKEALAAQLKCEVKDIKVDNNGYVIDEKNNPIVVVRSEFGIHFISVTWSSLEHSLQESVEYFMTDSSLENIEKGYYKNTEFNKGSTESISTLEKNRKREIEDRVVNYLQGGYAADVTADEQLMTYKIVKSYLSDIKIPDEIVKNSVTSFIDLKIDAAETKVSNAQNKTVETYVNKVKADKSLHDIVFAKEEN